MSCTLTAGRRALQQALGPFMYATATAGSTTTFTIAGAFLSSLLPNDHLTNMWVFSPTSAYPRVRRVASIDHTAGTGVLDGALGTAITSGTLLEFSAHLPAANQNDTLNGMSLIQGAIEDINEGLRHLLVETTRTLILADGLKEYPLATADALSLLNREGRLTDIYVPDVLGSGTHKLPAERWELQPKAGGNVLRFNAPFRIRGSSPLAQLQCLQPASSYINTGAAWADSVLGLVSESDLCWPEINDLVQVALVPAYRTLMNSRNGADRAKFAALYADQVNIARKTHNYDHSNDMDPSVPVAAPSAAAA